MTNPNRDPDIEARLKAYYARQEQAVLVPPVPTEPAKVPGTSPASRKQNLWLTQTLSAAAGIALALSLSFFADKSPAYLYLGVGTEQLETFGGQTRSLSKELQQKSQEVLGQWRNK